MLPQAAGVAAHEFESGIGKSDMGNAELAAKATRPVRKPVDLVHLSNQTMGDSELEREVLAIFVAQSGVLLNAWIKAGDAQSRMRAAHTLKGASRAIGAWALAELAGHAEEHDVCEPAALKAAIDEVCEYIRSLD